MKWSLILILLIILISCDETSSEDTKQKQRPEAYASLDTSNYFVGIETCASCHENKHAGFIQTGMGQSYGRAHSGKSVIPRDTVLKLKDEVNNLNYQIYWLGDSLKIKEFRLNEAGDTIHSLTKTVDHVIGSGHHTNSHIDDRNGYLYQMPFTFYTQDQLVDLPPGFDQGSNSRFSRKIGLECMSCHNSYPDFVKGSTNKFQHVANGINCERCHGPGGKHVELMKAGNTVDVNKKIDFSIVNPSKLTLDLQFDICQRCHLQGNTVLKEGKSFLDFQPGMHLSDVMTVFLPRYEGGEKDFIMASHADRLKMSKCFISLKDSGDAEALYPTKGQMTCITCHNPHESVRKKPKAFFDAQCQTCHAEENCLAGHVNDCVSCHMPKSGSIDIPHVSITDHYIRIPERQESQQTKRFLGLVAVNELNPNESTRLKAYINQYEKFDKNEVLLDSAKVYVNKLKKDQKSNIHALVHYYFVREDYQAIVGLVKERGVQEMIESWMEKSYDNQEAWTTYRIGDALNQKGLTSLSEFYFKKSCSLAPYVLDFQNKLASIYYKLGKRVEAEQTWKYVLSEDETNVRALSNLAYYLAVDKSNVKDGKKLIDQAVKLNPGYDVAWLNKAQIELLIGQNKEALFSLKQALKLRPNDQSIQQMIEKIK